MILSAASWKMYASRELLRLKRHLIQSQSFAISLSIRMKYTGWNAKKLKLIGCLLSTVRGKSMNALQSPRMIRSFTSCSSYPSNAPLLRSINKIPRVLVRLRLFAGLIDVYLENLAISLSNPLMSVIVATSLILLIALSTLKSLICYQQGLQNLIS